MGVKVPVSLPKAIDSQSIIIARELSMDLIKTMSGRLNYKTDNSF
jgi:hypothetical protein